MVNYKTNDNWFGDIRHLAKSWTMIKIMRAVFAVGVYSFIVCLSFEYFDSMTEYNNLNTSVFSLLGVVLSILLVFRTNTAYDRFWEGRKQWGALVNHSRNLAIYVHTMFPKENKDVRHFMATHISNFCISLVDHLREGVKLEKLINVSKEEINLYESKGHIPNQIALEIFDRIAVAHRNEEINLGDYINIKAQHQALLDILGACERIKKTPIPFSYSVYLKIFITAYGLLLPFALVNTFHLGTVPLVMFIFFAMVGVELMGEEIEDPFALNCNDLPTGDIAHTIKGNVFEILENKESTKRKVELYEKVF